MGHPATTRSATSVLTASLSLALVAAPLPASAVVPPNGERRLLATEDAPEELPEGLFVRSNDGRFSANVGGRVLFRYTYANRDEDGDHDTTSSFRIRQARLRFEGHAYGTQLRFKISTEFGRGNVLLRHGFVEYKAVPKVVHIRVGQFRLPFSREIITPRPALSLSRRSLVSSTFVVPWDIGIAVHNSILSSPTFEWLVGVFNGRGIDSTITGTTVSDTATGWGRVVDASSSNVVEQMAPSLVLRVGYNQDGIKGYSEADLEGGPLRVAIAAGMVAELNADGDRNSKLRGVLDYAVKAYGFSSTGAIYLASDQKKRRFRSQRYSGYGYHAQAGRVFMDRFHPTVRYTRIVPRDENNDTHDIAVGMSIYFFGYKVRWLTDAAIQLRETARDDHLTDTLVRSQLMFII